VTKPHEFPKTGLSEVSENHVALSISTQRKRKPREHQSVFKNCSPFLLKDTTEFHMGFIWVSHEFHDSNDTFNAIRLSFMWVSHEFHYSNDTFNAIRLSFIWVSYGFHYSNDTFNAIQLSFMWVSHEFHYSNDTFNAI
jgi:hypothetical protein